LQGAVDSQGQPAPTHCRHADLRREQMHAHAAIRILVNAGCQPAQGDAGGAHFLGLQQHFRLRARPPPEPQQSDAKQKSVM
jgi:hypothetical protein